MRRDSSRACDIIDLGIAQLSIVIRELGFQPGRGHRARCILCDATNPTTFSFKPDGGTWFCFRCGRGGGVLDLVQAVRGCDRRSALGWLADHLELALTDRQWSVAERRDFASRRRRAEVVAARVAVQRRERIRTLIDRRNDIHDDDRRLCSIARGLSEDDLRWQWIWEHALDHLEADDIQAEINRLEVMSPREWIGRRAAA